MRLFFHSLLERGVRLKLDVQDQWGGKVSDIDEQVGGLENWIIFMDNIFISFFSWFACNARVTVDASSNPLVFLVKIAVTKS